MKYNNLSMIFGILFAVGLGALAYLSFILAIVLSFMGIEWFISMMFVFAGIAVSTLGCACFARRKIIVTFVMDLISLVVVLFVIIYLSIVGIFAEIIAMLTVFGGVFIFGVLSLLFSILAKKNANLETIKDV